MRNDVVTHLFDDDGHQLCNQHGPVISAPAILLDAGDSVFCPSCPSCARAVLAPIVQHIHTWCGVALLSDEHKASDGHLLLQAILSLVTTPPDDEAAVMRIMGAALDEMGGYIDEARGDHA